MGAASPRLLWTMPPPIREAKLRVWDLESWDEPFHRTDEGWVDSMAWSPDGEHLALALTEPCCEPVAAGPRNGVVRVLDRAGREVSTFRDEDDWVHVLSLGFTPDGAQLLGPVSDIGLGAVLRHRHDLGLASRDCRAGDRNGRLHGGAEPRR